MSSRELFIRHVEKSRKICGYLHVLGFRHVYLPSFLFGDCPVNMLSIELDNSGNAGLVNLVGDELLRHLNQHLLSRLTFTFSIDE